MLLCGVKLPKGVDVMVLQSISMVRLNEKVRYVCKAWSAVVDTILKLRLKRMDLWKCSGFHPRYCSVQALLEYPK